MCEKLAEVCSRGSPQRILLPERGSYRCQAYAHQGLTMKFWYRDGKSRQFGFVGFRTEHEAEEAINQIARKVGDPDIPRPWSRHSLKKKENSSEEEKIVGYSKVSEAVVQEGKSKKSKKDDENDDPQLQEFLQVMQHRSMSKLWANDALAAPSLEQSKVTSDNKFQMTKGHKNKLDGEGADLDGIKGEGNVLSEKQEADRPNILVHDEVVSDIDYFKSRIKKQWSDSVSSDDEGSNSDGNDDRSDSQTKKRHDPLEDTLEPDVLEGEAEDGSSREHGINGSADPSSSPKNKIDEVLDTGRLFIRNLPYSATALKEMDTLSFQGRLLHIMPAKPKHLSDVPETNGADKLSSKTFKQQRNAERKASEETGNTRSWNTFFMRPDTVVENFARKFGVSKSELLDRESDDLALKIALGETQVLAETKKALSSAGVNVSSLEEFAAGKTDGLKRSNHVILVKNLPYGSSEPELSNMFGKFGSLDKIILPPTKTLALVWDGPLYLEWAPGNILSQTSTVGDSKVVGELDVNRALLERQVEDTTDADVDPDRIEVKKHLKKGKNVSMGFGFIEFDCVDTAVNVCKDLQGTVLDGHALILQLCHAKKDEVVSKKIENDRSSTKLIVRNVAFEATEKDLRQLFSPFGQIKSLRLPMRFGNHRGFAFVEYVTKQEARNALEALSNTHLYGRHLVLERAKEGESLEELRARTAAQFTDSAKLSKKRKHLAILDEGNLKFEGITE
ncbi:hypothetical protein DH2020_017775 [Rehmannia glutinosa]|uniref:RRM domain-containing protein n=1 Tax=Rehmannia glutinosa TaxID=99300 RepID=A0ABR0WVM0_REHGL